MSWLPTAVQWLAQALVLAAALWGAAAARRVDPATGRRRWSALGLLTVSGLVTGFLAFGLADLFERAEARAAVDRAAEEAARERAEADRLRALLEELRSRQHALARVEVSWPVPATPFVEALNEALDRDARLRDPSGAPLRVDPYLLTALVRGEVRLVQGDLPRLEARVADRDGAERALRFEPQDPEFRVFGYLLSRLVLLEGFALESEDGRRLLELPGRERAWDVRLQRGRAHFTLERPGLSLHDAAGARVRFAFEGGAERPALLPPSIRLRIDDPELTVDEELALAWSERVVRTRDGYDAELEPIASDVTRSVSELHELPR